jgi:hypothetical protein
MLSLTTDFFQNMHRDIDKLQQDLIGDARANKKPSDNTHAKGAGVVLEEEGGEE